MLSVLGYFVIAREISAKKLRTKQNTLCTEFFCFNCVLRDASVRTERQQRQIAGALNRHGQQALVLCTAARNAARQNLTAFRNVLAELVCVLIINLFSLIYAEAAYLSASSSASFTFHALILPVKMG